MNIKNEFIRTIAITFCLTYPAFGEEQVNNAAVAETIRLLTEKIAPENNMILNANGPGVSRTIYEAYNTEYFDFLMAHFNAFDNKSIYNFMVFQGDEFKYQEQKRKLSEYRNRYKYLTVNVPMPPKLPEYDFKSGCYNLDDIHLKIAANYGFVHVRNLFPPERLSLQPDTDTIWNVPDQIIAVSPIKLCITVQNAKTLKGLEAQFNQPFTQPEVNVNTIVLFKVTPKTQKKRSYTCLKPSEMGCLKFSSEKINFKILEFQPINMRIVVDGLVLE